MAGLRIDRSKIDVARAWMNDAGPQMEHGRWHHVTYEMHVSAGDDGWARAFLDGQEVVGGTGRTMMTTRMEWIDRVQVGLTANSNPEPAELWVDNVKIDVTAPAPERPADAARTLDRAAAKALADAERWQALAASCANSNVFFEHWAVQACQILPEGEGLKLLLVERIAMAAGPDCYR